MPTFCKHAAPHIPRLFRGDEYGEVEEVPTYWERAKGGISVEHIDAVMGIAREMQLDLLTDCLADRTLLAQLSSRDQKAYAALLDEAEAAGGPHALESLLPLDRLLQFCAVTPSGSMLWRNQAGPMQRWKRAGDTPYPSSPDPKHPDTKRFIDSLAPTQPGARYTNVFIMGMPRSLSAKYIARQERRLAELGYMASAAPNSVCIKSPAASKALPVGWLTGTLADAPSAQMSMRHAVAFGDNPCGNDRALTTISGLHFVSVAASEPNLPERLRPYAVGGLEAGTACVLTRLAETQRRACGQPVEVTSELLRDICAAARAQTQALQMAAPSPSP
mmetsp:Transcript_11207/g.29642  ORF Transcript_11207/g.29642 Transcript_11207/m.29642 type:complete len:332 (-) Transcript_11207:86-1081(-)